MQASFWAREPIPVLTAAALAVVNGGIQLLIAFGLTITQAQGAAIGGFVSAVIVSVALVMRSQVSPATVVATAVNAISDHMDNGELRAASVELRKLAKRVDPKGDKGKGDTSGPTAGVGTPDAPPPLDPPAFGGAARISYEIDGARLDVPELHFVGRVLRERRSRLMTASAPALVAVLTALLLAGCTSAEGRTAATIVTGACGIGSVLIPGLAGVAPLCADVALVEKIIEDWNHPSSPTMAHAPGPIPAEELYKRALAGGAKPIPVSK